MNIQARKIIKLLFICLLALGLYIPGAFAEVVILVNGEEDFVALPPGEPVTLGLGLSPGPLEGQPGDVFLLGANDSGLFHFDPGAGWGMPVGGIPGVVPVLTSPIPTLDPPIQVPGFPLPDPNMPSTLALVLDFTPDGALNLDDPNLTFDIIFTNPETQSNIDPEPEVSANGDGNAVLAFTIGSDLGLHKVFIFNGWTKDQVRARCNTFNVPGPGVNGPASLTCEFTPPFEDGPGDDVIFPTLSGTINNGAFSLSGNGMVAGFPNIDVTFEGTAYSDQASPVSRSNGDCDPGVNSWMYTVLSGTLTFGASGGLPGGLPLTASAIFSVPPTTSVVSGNADAGTSWLLVTADKDAVARCSYSAPSTSCPDIVQANTVTIISRNNNSPTIFDQAKSYFHYTLPTLPAGTNIEGAFINLYDVENMITPSQDSFPIEVAASSWDPGTLTWSNQPNATPGGSLGASIGPFIDQFRWRGHANSIASHIQQIYAGQADNNGFVLDVQSNGSYSRGFYTVNTGAANAPRLYLQVSSSADLDDSNVIMPAPPADAEIPSYVFILGDTLPEDTCFATN